MPQDPWQRRALEDEEMLSNVRGGCVGDVRQGVTVQGEVKGVVVQLREPINNKTIGQVNVFFFFNNTSRFIGVCHWVSLYLYSIWDGT